MAVMLDRDSVFYISEWFQRIWAALKRRCARTRASELQAYMPEASALWPAPGPPREPSPSSFVPTPRLPSPIGLVIALKFRTYDSFYAHSLEAWDCYCQQHGDCRLLVDTVELPDEMYPQLVRKDIETGRLRLAPGKEWNRWIALARHLDAFDVAITVDPDQFPSRECLLNLSFSTVFQVFNLSMFGEVSDGLPDRPGILPDIIMRDSQRFQTLQSTSVVFRRTRGARLFLRLLFDNMRWERLPVLDQSAFEQTVLEFLELWADASGFADASERVRSATCLEALFFS